MKNTDFVKEYMPNLLFASLIWVGVSLAACDFKVEEVSYTMSVVAADACHPWGGVVSFDRKELSDGIYVQAKCLNNGTRIRTRVAIDREELAKKDRKN